jgi:hypothetical protein
MAAVLAQPKVKRLLSSDHFSVDGTLIEAWASIKSFRRKDGAMMIDRALAATLSGTSTRRSVQTKHIRARPIRKQGLQEGRWAAGKALLHGACPDGEPAWLGGRRRRKPGDRHSRT